MRYTEVIQRYFAAAVVTLAAHVTIVAAEEPLAEPTWSRDDTDQSPDGSVKFRGPFNNEQVMVAWKGLPAHDFVRVEVELLILRSWDGSVPLNNRCRPTDGPDYFRCALTNGPILLSTTFSNLPADDPGFIAAGKTQAFPSPIPGDRLPPQTGAQAASSMGYH